MSEYNLKIQQVVDYPRCRVYREFVQTLIADRNIRVNGCSGLFHYTVLCFYANFRTSYRRLDWISYTVYPGEWICRINELQESLRLRTRRQVVQALNRLQDQHLIQFSELGRGHLIKYRIVGWRRHNTVLYYTHITDDMQRQAAANIDRGIGKAAPPESSSEPEQETTPSQGEKSGITDFQPVPRKQHRPGTGCISQKGPTLWEGRYSPTWIDGKKHARNVYAHTREECEEKLQKLIIEMKTELAELKRQKAEGTLTPQEVKKSKEKGRKKAKKTKKKSKSK